MIKEKHIVNKTYGGHQLSRYIDVYEVTTNGCSSSPMSGYKGTEATLVDDPAWNEKFSSYSITGATLTGNNFVINNDVTAQANYETAKNVTLQTDGHGSIAANKMSGFIGDQATLSNTANARYAFSGYSITGATLTGNKFNFTGTDVTAKAWFSAIPYNVTLQNDGHGTITASNTTGNTNDIITLSNTPAANYYFNNYTITGATLTGNQFKIQTSDVTAKANFAAMPVSSLFVSSNAGITAGTWQTKTFTVNVDTAKCNYIKIRFYRSYRFDGGYKGMGWSIPELGWTGRNTSVITDALELRNGSFTKNNQFWNASHVITTGGNQWIIDGTYASYLKYVYDVKNQRMSALYDGYVVGYGNCSTLGNTLTFNLTVGGTLGSAEMNNFRVAGFRDYTAATAWLQY